MCVLDAAHNVGWRQCLDIEKLERVMYGRDAQQAEAKERLDLTKCLVATPSVFYKSH
jgi:hypothetical protein